MMVKRLTMKKYAKKYANKRTALYGTVEIKETTKENTAPTPVPVVECVLPEPEVVETSPVDPPNALREIETSNAATKATKTRRRRRKASKKPKTRTAIKATISETSR